MFAGCSKKTGTSDDAAGEQVIKDDSKIVSITDEYEAVSIDLEPAASWTLPLGTLLYYCDGDYAAAMMAPASARHANTLGVLNLGDGSLTTLIGGPSKVRGIRLRCPRRRWRICLGRDELCECIVEALCAK